MLCEYTDKTVNLNHGANVIFFSSVYQYICMYVYVTGHMKYPSIIHHCPNNVNRSFKKFTYL